MPGARLSEGLAETVSHELRPLKRTPRPNRPLTRRTSCPTAPFLQAGGVAEPHALRVGLVEAVGGDEAVLGGGGGRSPGERQPNQQPGEERDDQRAGGAVRSSRGRDRPSPGGCGARSAPAGVGVACESAPPWARERRGAMLHEPPPGVNPRRLSACRRPELVKTAVKSAECGAGPAYSGGWRKPPTVVARGGHAVYPTGEVHPGSGVEIDCGRKPASGAGEASPNHTGSSDLGWVVAGAIRRLRAPSRRQDSHQAMEGRDR